MCLTCVGDGDGAPPAPRPLAHEVVTEQPVPPESRAVRPGSCGSPSVARRTNPQPGCGFVVVGVVADGSAGARGEGSGVGAGLDLGQVLHQAGLVAAGLVLVDDALGGGLVDALDGEAGGLDGRARPARRPRRRSCVRVLSSERTALLRTRRFSFCLLRLIWLLMFATWCPGSLDRGVRGGAGRERSRIAGSVPGHARRGRPWVRFRERGSAPLRSHVAHEHAICRFAPPSCPGARAPDVRHQSIP